MWIIAFVVALLGTLFALSGVGEVSRAEPEPTSPPLAASAKSATTTVTPAKESDEPDALHFAVSSLRLPSDSPETRCVMALGRGALDECKQIALAALPTAEEPSLGRLRYLLARATSNDPAAQRPALETLAATSHPLAAIAKVRLSELLRESDPRAALDATESLLLDPRWKNRMEPLRAVLLNRVGRTTEAEAALRALVEEAPSTSSAAPASMTLAAMLANRSDVSARKQALALYRRVYTRVPLTATGEQARQQAAQILKGLPPAERAASQQSFGDAMTEADSMLASRAYERAYRTYGNLEKRAGKDLDGVCAARLGQGKALLAMRRTGDSVPVFLRAAADCQGDAKANGHLQAARSIFRVGDPARAISHYEEAVKIASDTRIADEALYSASQAYLDINDAVGARNSLTQLLDHDNQGETRTNARFALAWLERQAGNLEASQTHFALLLSENPVENTEGMGGRAAYWHARTLLDQGNKTLASAEFVALFRSRPLTYYAQQGLARLQEFDGKAAAIVVNELRDPTPKPGIWMAVQPELKTQEFERAVELLRCGEPSRAQEELNALGVFDRKGTDEMYLLGTALLMQFGAQSASTTLVRRCVGTIMRSAPRGEKRGLWRVAFPQAYAPLIDDIARNAGVPPAFVRAIAREESSFDPGAVSSANAYGLIQVIKSTAKAYGRPLGLPHDPAALKTPEVNLRIGVNFMRDLFQRYGQNPAIVPSAYNAGSGAAERWLRERPTMQLDEWIESIPYFETRRYTRRVLQTYGVYSWLDEGQVPTLRSRLPNSQVPPSVNETTALR